MCADCHSTNVKKGFSAATNSYATTFSEIDVSCEACHGPGSAHVAWAEAVAGGQGVEGRRGPRARRRAARSAAKAAWEMDPKTGIAKRTVPRTSHMEIETCARCHARRSVAAADYVYGRPLAQTHRASLLDDPQYFADGQIQDEVYEYGSFLQSKMFAAGVSCSDCHDPHDLKVKGSADRVCAVVPPPRAVRHAGAPLPPGRLEGRELRRLPHADARLHGRPRAARPQHAHPAAGPVGLARHAERLQRLPPRQVRAVGLERGAEVVGRQDSPGAELRRDRARGARGARRSARGARRVRDRRRAAGREARDGGVAPGSVRARRSRRARAGARRSGSSRPPRRARGGGGTRARGARPPRRAAASRSGPHGPPRGGPRSRARPTRDDDGGAARGLRCGVLRVRRVASRRRATGRRRT